MHFIAVKESTLNVMVQWLVFKCKGLFQLHYRLGATHHSLDSLKRCAIFAMRIFIIQTNLPGRLRSVCIFFKIKFQMHKRTSFASTISPSTVCPWKIESFRRFFNTLERGLLRKMPEYITLSN